MCNFMTYDQVYNYVYEVLISTVDEFTNKLMQEDTVDVFLNLVPVRCELEACRFFSFLPSDSLSSLSCSLKSSLCSFAYKRSLNFSR